MTDQPPPGWYPDPAQASSKRYWDGSVWTEQRTKPKGRFPRPHWRKMTWVLIVWSALILWWAIGGAASNKCAHQQYQSACQAGTGIGVALVLFLGFIGFVFFSLIWFMSRPKGRDCPVCGEKVKKGLTVCPGCGHDFATVPQGTSGAVSQSDAALASGTEAAPVVAPPPQVPEGWFPDPTGSGNERYWNGDTWTPEVRKPQG